MDFFLLFSVCVCVHVCLHVRACVCVHKFVVSLFARDLKIVIHLCSFRYTVYFPNQLAACVEVALFTQCPIVVLLVWSSSLGSVIWLFFSRVTGFGGGGGVMIDCA